MIETGTLIVGGGLSGLHSAWRLAESGADVLLLEAGDRLGGRILSGAAETAPEAAYDLGPTWFWPGQTRIDRLTRTLDLEVFRQPSDGAVMHEDPSGAVSPITGYSLMPDSFRLRGGIAALVTGLRARIPPDRIRLGTRVTALNRRPSGLEAVTLGPDGNRQTVVAGCAILALPPRLAVEHIAFTPDLPAAARSAAAAVPTWMAGHAKLVALYDRPFWRDAGLSGAAISRRGPLMEIHDASPLDGGPAALFGFVGVPAAGRAGRRNALIAAALDQLARLFGPAAGEPLQTLLKDWSQDPLTAVAADQQPLTHHPAYGLPPALDRLWDGRLIFASSEVAREHGGLLEGALEASEAALAQALADKAIHS